MRLVFGGLLGGPSCGRRSPGRSPAELPRKRNAQLADPLPQGVPIDAQQFGRLDLVSPRAAQDQLQEGTLDTGDEMIV
jgi:hypothetical protein